MNLIDAAAILGALAWTPHVVGLVKRWLMKAHVRVITGRTAEIGFTTHGPIFNVRLAFAVSNKDLVVSDLRIRLIHESGEEKIFEWQGITQPVGKTTLPDSTVMPFEREQSVLAIKLSEKDIEERFIRCQDVSFIASKAEYESNALKKLTYLKAEGKYDADTFLREPEMIDLYGFIKHAFSWKEGHYQVHIELSSPEHFDIVDDERVFYLTPLDIDALSKNTDLIELDYRQMAAAEGGKTETGPASWQWRNPTLTKD